MKSSKMLDTLTLLRRGGPALCNVAVTNACNAACGFCNFARGKVPRANLRWIDADQFGRALDILHERDIRYISFFGGLLTLIYAVNIKEPVFILSQIGGIVIYRAARSDVTYAFLLSYASMLFGRAFWLGDPWAIPLKQLQSGALLLFAFYMISDPKTTPDSRAGRILFAALVAAGAAYVQFGLYRTNALLWSLALCSIATPIIDRLLPAVRYQWNNRTPSKQAKGETREINDSMAGQPAFIVH